MTITLGAYTLCHGATRTQDQAAGPSSLRISSARQSQLAPRLRAAQARMLPRGNRAESVSFGVAVRCASVSAATAFIAGLPAAVPASGALSLGAVAYGTASCDFTAEQSGATVLISYNLTCGASS